MNKRFLLGVALGFGVAFFISPRDLLGKIRG